ncbi:tol-pal system protein YbgF [Pseudochryseolinea flava]|uniref:Tol-pal system protein YbgF n=2 Tax=Pseudochryseolinea flava TaxID=2059302 RepID=A0A364Y6U7_9BACT|nr:tol-pal system protein YbgF [Pseudochryseolinea flava]
MIIRSVKHSFRYVIIAFFLFVAQNQVSAQYITDKDTTIILISDPNVQLECTQALNDLYNFKFPAAEYQFQYLRAKYKWHPLPYFLMGLIEWWKIMPNTKDTSHDEKFLAYMDSTIEVGEELYDDYPQYRVEASFFLAAAYGFKGRLYSDEERKNWRKAASAGKDALDYLEEGKTKENLSPELLFGDALYNYFSVWVPENYPALKPVLWFFRKGDKALGLKQLKEVSYNAFYTRTEAMVWLMRILNSYENDQPQAFQISKYLHEQYPDNPYFHRYYARMLYSMGRFTEAEPECRNIIARIDSAQVGYEATSGRYASFFLGQIYEARRKPEEAKGFYLRCLKYAEEIEATETGYYLYSLIALGEIAEQQGDKKEAKRYFELVKKKADRKDEAFKDAKRRLKGLEKGD